MKKKDSQLPRREFCKILAVGGAGALLTPLAFRTNAEQIPDDEKPGTNIKDAMQYPRNVNSMPGRFPGGVVQVNHEGSMKEGSPQKSAVYDMVKAAMLELTSAGSLQQAWSMFFTQNDRIGIKVNPVAGATLSTTPEVVMAITDQLLEAGIPRENLVIWDRREFELADAGFTPLSFPGIKLAGTECMDENKSYYDSKGMLYSLDRIDRDWYYWADVEESYDDETLPYMVNSGKYSFFSKICTRDVDKIINVPILKNAGASVTLCLKNLAFGAITNTGRLHKKLWNETCAEVCAFPPLRDKVVLNIVDGLRGCYNGGPGANPQFIEEYKLILAGTDPVAVDRVGFEIITKRRIEQKTIQKENPKGRIFLTLAENLGLGTSDLEKINWKKINLG